MAATIPKFKFYNGYEIPILGLGTWKSQPGEVKAAVEAAIDVGYRHIDCAHVYGNEKEVGAALKAKMDEGVVKREELFITSKLWNTSHQPDLVEPACKKTLEHLGLEYLDLYLIHWPFAYKEGDNLFPSVDDKLQFSDVDYVDTWKAMETLVPSGLTRNIGVSNFNAAQLTRLIKNTTIKPVTNQIECHPYLNQSKLSKLCKEQGILITAYSPLGSPDRPYATPDDPILLEDSKLKAIAEKYKKSPAQTLIRYQLEKERIVIPKSVTKSRIAQNMAVFDFKLSTDDIEHLDSLDCNGRICPMTTSFGHKYHPFENDAY